VALLYAMADTTVSAVVSLDGSIGFADRVPTYVTLPGWHPERALAPVLHLRAPDEDREDLSALESIPAPLRIETIPAAVHLDFTDLGPLSAHGLAVPAIGMGDEDGDEIHAGCSPRPLRFSRSTGVPASIDSRFVREQLPSVAERRAVARSGQVD
jgi:hypothetical protein